MAIEILMPALSPTMTEGNLVRWLVAEGDRVQSGDVIAEIETDKATMEVEAVEEGRLGRILVPEGSEGVAVNTVIAVLAGEGEEMPAAPTPAPVPSGALNGSDPEPARTGAEGGEVAATPLARRMAALAHIPVGKIVGSGAGGKVTADDVRVAAGRTPRPPDRPAARRDRERIFASPFARRLAAEAELPLEHIRGSGPEGRIIARDVRRAEAEGVRAPERQVGAPADGLPPYERIRHSSMRRVIARRLVESKSTAPHFRLTVDCGIDGLLAARREVNADAPDGIKVSVNDFVIKALALALHRVPEANAAWEDDAVLRFSRADISVAVATPGGLITPVVRGAAAKGLGTISAEMADFAARARAGKLLPEEYRGGTSSVSNLGMYGVRQFDAVLNPPQATILAVGAGEQRPVVRDGALAVSTVMTCTLSCDHRVVDGALGAELLSAFRALVERPATMLL